MSTRWSTTTDVRSQTILTPATVSETVPVAGSVQLKLFIEHQISKAACPAYDGRSAEEGALSEALGTAKKIILRVEGMT